MNARMTNGSDQPGGVSVEACTLPVAERPKLEVADVRGPAFQARLAALKRTKAAFSVCDVEVPARPQ